MFDRLASTLSRRPRRVLLITLLFIVVSGVFGGPVAGLLSTGDDFGDPNSESLVTTERLERAGGAGTDPGIVVLVSPQVAIDGPAARMKIDEVTAVLEDDPDVARTVSFLTTRDRSFVSRDGRETYVLAYFKAGTEDEDAAERLESGLEGRPGVTVGGPALAGPAVGEQVGEDLARAELLAFPILFILLLFVFRGVVAALLPLFVGVTTIFGTFLGLRLINEATLLSIFALNLAIALGLGLAIDYSLFIVSRYREEMARSGPGREALSRTLRSAGRTVLFSAVTVATALASLTVFPQRFLYSMGLSGAITALVAAAVALLALPAMLALLGRRVNALAPKRWQRAAERTAQGETGFWHRLSGWVMRRPLAVAAVTGVVLIAMGLPFAGIQFTGVDAGVLPKDSGPRQVDDALKTRFPASSASPITLSVERGAGEEELRSYAARLDRIEGVAAVAPPQVLADGSARVDVVAERPALDARTLDVVREIRRFESPVPVGVAGQSAEFVDQQQSLASRLPLAVAVLIVTTLVVLFLMTGSVVLPIKSLVMNLLSLSAAFGLLVLIFQDGRLEGILGYTSQGALEATQPIVLFAIAFGLSTDYGVFLLTRIKEARDAGASDNEAVSLGLERTGRIITAAALLFVVAIGAFATSEIIFIKQVGIGTALAVLIDATIIRALLVPALMALLGRRNWWAPGPLKRLHSRLGIEEASTV